MGTAIVVTSGKGGAGKSTVSLGLAAHFAAEGARVLLIDCDAGLRSLDRMTGTEEALVFDSSDVVAGRCAPAEAIYPCASMPGVSLLPAPQNGEDLVPEHVMRRLVPMLKRYFDRVILDSPAGVGRGFRAAAAGADSALIVCSPDPVCIRGGKCVDACPMYLQPLYLYRYALAGDKAMLDEYYLNDCMECGCCSFVCPGKLPLTATFVEAKHMLKKGGK